MKFSNILLSVFLHAGLLAGVMCGLQCHDEIGDEQIEPVFFEILEECTVAASEPVAPATVQTESSSMKSEDKEKETAEISDLEPLVVENTIRTEFSDELELDAGEESEEGVEAEADKDDDKDKEKEGIGDIADKEEKEVAEEKKPEKPQEASEAVKPMEQEQAKVVSAPTALNRIVPVYPRSARRRGREGLVTVEISVSDFGEVSGVEVIAGSGHKDLDSAAVSAVRTARFAPATEDGIQVHGRLRLTFEFRLR